MELSHSVSGIRKSFPMMKCAPVFFVPVIHNIFARYREPLVRRPQREFRVKNDVHNTCSSGKDMNKPVCKFYSLLSEGGGGVSEGGYHLQFPGA